MSTLVEWLADDSSRVMEVLRRRPDMDGDGAPRTTDELAWRLQHPLSLMILCEALPQPHLEMMEALQALGLGATERHLNELLTHAGPEHDALASAVLADLIDAAVAWPADDGRIQVASGPADLWPFPLGLSYSGRQMIPSLSAHDLRQIALCQQIVKLPTRRAELEVVVLERVSDPDWIRSQVAGAPPEIAEAILALAQPHAVAPDILDDDYLYYVERSSRSQKVIRALYREVEPKNGELVRNAVIACLWQQPPDQAVPYEIFATTLLWDRPILSHIAPPGLTPWANAWSEAETLGLLAHGVLTEIGRAVPEAEPADLIPLALEMLPANSDSAIFGSDLTVMVLGSPSARVSRLLDSAAVRESRGAAITWRFSTESVPKVLDAGTTAEALEADLAAVATGDLPQPLRYLIQDIGRRHGEVQLSPAASVIRSADTAKLAEVAADRALRRLGLRLVSPNVVTSQAPLDETLAALRRAGYFPMPEGEPSAEPR